jgi:uncharacterized protein YtpQ (UPF0354 family)
MSFFKKLFGNKEEKGTTLKTPIEDFRKSRDGYVNVGESVFPTIKDKNDDRINILEGDKAVVTEKIADDLVMCHSIDLGDKYELVSGSLLESPGLTAENIKHCSMRNLHNKVSTSFGIKPIDLSDQIPEAKPFYTIHFDDNFNPSVMLVDDIWDKDILSKYINDGRVAVSIPSKNVIFFSDMRIMESFRSMRAYSAIMYESAKEEGLALSKNTYIRKDGKWIKFLDTEEQWEELW